jgi:protein TonB
MDFGVERRTSPNTIIGIGIVILLHVLLVYALVTGLATSVVDVIKKPLEIKIIQASAPPPPPPAMTPPPPPMITPPPPYIPPPLIQITPPVAPPPVFAVTTTVKPPAPVQTAPRAAPTVAPVSTDVGVICSNLGGVAAKLSDQFQDIADQDNIDSARVVVQIMIAPDGSVSSAKILSSDAPDLNGLALQGVRGLSCRGQGQTVQATQPFEFKTQ